MDGRAIASVKTETLFRGNVITCLFGMNEQLKTFGTNLVRQMTSAKIGAAVLAEWAGVSVKTVNNVIQGRHATQIDNLAKLADALKVQFWMMWLPDLPPDAKNDRTIQSLMEISTQLSEPALLRITRMAELELNAERSDGKPKKIASIVETQPKR
jgi:plasmid maintenance system antidote protein VapI